MGKMKTLTIFSQGHRNATLSACEKKRLQDEEQKAKDFDKNDCEKEVDK